jgi:hypothetical protein
VAVATGKETPMNNRTGIVMTEAPPPDIELKAVAISEVRKIIRKSNIR